MGGRRVLNQSTSLKWQPFFFLHVKMFMLMFPYHAGKNLSSVRGTHGKINAHTYLSFKKPSSSVFWGLTGEKKISASIITKDSLFGTLPPQMAECLMFPSRCVAFSLPWMGCVHNHCLMSKIEGKPCKLWMPPCQRHGTAKTMCADISFALLRLHAP